MRNVLVLFACVAFIASIAGCAVERRSGATGPAWTAADRPVFVKAPTARLDGDKIVVNFEVSKPTDVAVLVKDSSGRVVRHVVAGLLGPRPPFPLAPSMLEQTLEWDLRDDDGFYVPAGRYRVEVQLGLTVTLDRFLGWNPRELGTVHGLALSPDGELYVMSEAGRDNLDPKFQVFTTGGKYVRTIVPRPASIPLDRAKPLGEVVLGGGERFPSALLPQYGCRRFQQPVVTAEGDLIFANVAEPPNHAEAKRFASVAWEQTLERRLLRIAADGGAPEAGYLGPVLGQGFESALLYLALGPDGLIYISGANDAVFRAKWGEKEKPEPFIGTPGKPGAGTDLRKSVGIAFDVQGNLYVADRGNHRIAVFDKTGALVSQIPVEWPQLVAVHPRSGAVYVAAGFDSFRLLKFADMLGKKPVASCDLRTDSPFIALDPRPDEPAIYVANVRAVGPGADSRNRILVRLDDEGDRFEFERVLSDYSRPKQPLLCGVDRRRDLVFGNWPYEGYWRMNGRSGSVQTFSTLLAPKANGISEISAASDGSLLVHVTSELGRLDRNLLPLPFGSTGTYIAEFPREDCVRSFYGRDCAVAPNGDLYWIFERGGYAQPMRCSALNADGSLKKDSLIVFDTGSPAGIRVDRDGCIYVLDHLKPLDKPFPDAFAGIAQPVRSDRYVHHYGSILKFKPTGGAVRLAALGAAKVADLRPGEMQFTAAEGVGDFRVEGALWAWYGASCIRPARPRDGCECWTPRFDLDDFARVFVPDELRCRVVVLDSNGNELLAFGRYGNPDDAGPGIPLADPRTVAVSDGAAYVGDMTDGRVVRCSLTCQDSASCSVRVPGLKLADLIRSLAAKDPAGQSEPIRRSMAQVRRLMNAEMRVEEVRAEAAELSPYLDRRVDWDSLRMRVLNCSASALANFDDARAVLAVAAPRELPYWPERQAKALLGRYMAEGSEWLRLSVVWGLWGGKLGDTGLDLLRRACEEDVSQLVRVVAAGALPDATDPGAFAEILTGVLAADPRVYKMAETALLKKFLPAASTLAYGPKEISLLADVVRESRAAGGADRTRDRWYLHAAAIQLLAASRVPEAGAVLLAELKQDEHLTGNNLNRVIEGLGTLRHRPAIPELIKYLARGADPEFRGGHSDKAEVCAATALTRMDNGISGSLLDIAALLDSDKPGTAAGALRVLSEVCDRGIPAEMRLVPKKGKLERVRVDALPAPKDIRTAWESFLRELNRPLL